MAAGAQVLLVVIKAAMAKALLPWWEVLLLGFMAGAYVGVGGTFAVMIAGGISCSGTSCARHDRHQFSSLKRLLHMTYDGDMFACAERDDIIAQRNRSSMLTGCHDVPQHTLLLPYAR